MTARFFSSPLSLDHAPKRRISRAENELFMPEGVLRMADAEKIGGNEKSLFRKQTKTLLKTIIVYAENKHFAARSSRVDEKPSFDRY